MIEILLGTVLAIGTICIFRMMAGKRERTNYAIALIIAALIYVGFSLFADDSRWILIELVGVAIYLVFAILGLRYSAWFLALGWVAHIVWDMGLHTSPAILFVPKWYPLLCVAYDVVIAGYIAFRNLRQVDSELVEVQP